MPEKMMGIDIQTTKKELGLYMKIAERDTKILQLTAENEQLQSVNTELLEACEAMLNAMIRYRDAGQDGDFWNEATAMGRAAIAKARGSTTPPEPAAP